MKVDREIEARGSQPADQRELGREPPDAARTRRDDQLVDIGVVLDDRGGGRLDEIRDVRVGKASADGANGRCREDDIADLAQAHEQDLQSSIVASSISITGMSSLMG